MLNTAEIQVGNHAKELIVPFLAECTIQWLKLVKIIYLKVVEDEKSIIPKTQKTYGIAGGHLSGF